MMKPKAAFEFCPRCGGRFDKHENLKCPACGLNFYINPKPTVTVVIINRKKEVLLVKRAVEPSKGLWDFPGGFVEENETLEENGRREIKEELGLAIGRMHYLGSVLAPYLYQEVEYPTLAVIFVSNLLEDVSLKPADDVASCRFFCINELPVEKFAFPAMKKTAKLAADYLSGSDSV